MINYIKFSLRFLIAKIPAALSLLASQRPIWCAVPGVKASDICKHCSIFNHSQWTLTWSISGRNGLGKECTGAWKCTHWQRRREETRNIGFKYIFKSTIKNSNSLKRPVEAVICRSMRLHWYNSSFLNPKSARSLARQTRASLSVGRERETTDWQRQRDRGNVRESREDERQRDGEWTFHNALLLTTSACWLGFDNLSSFKNTINFSLFGRMYLQKVEKWYGKMNFVMVSEFAWN